MSYLIGSKSKCEAYNTKATAAAGHSGDSTERWATPRKHPNKDLYAIVKHPTTEPDSDMQQVEELGEDWQPDEPKL